MVELLEAELFRRLKPAELAELLRSSQERAFSPGEEIFSEGDPGDGLFVVKSGMVEIAMNSGRDHHQVFSVVGPGETFGEMAIIDQLPRSAYATAVQTTRVLFLSHAVVHRLMERSTDLTRALLQLVSQRLREFNQHHVREVLQAERLAAVGQFARSIVHDLKNPINMIGLTTELLGKSEATPALLATVRSRIGKQLERMNDLVTDMLQFTQGGQTINPIPANYADFINPLVTDLRAELENRSVQLELPDPPPDLVVSFDARRLRRVFHNLIHNAAEAIPAEGTVTLRFRQTEAAVITEVADTGGGIPTEIVPRLFQPFTTFGKAHGSGLGLSICKKIITDHGGEISAENHPDGGAVFTFSLPLKTRPG